MITLFSHESGNPKINAQRNLTGRTHYVDDATLRYHHSRILSTHVTDNGLLFGLVESVALDMHNTKRGYRPVVFDLLGNTYGRVDLGDCFKSSKAAEKALRGILNGADARLYNLNALDRAQDRSNGEYNDLRAKIQAL